MKAAENIEKLIKKFCDTKKTSAATSAEMDKRVLDDALQAYEKSKTKRTAEIQLNVWRIIMKSRITKLAAAVVIVIGLVVLFGNGQTSLYAQVMKVLENARTIHVVGKSLRDGQWEKALEVWYDRERGVVETEWLSGRQAHIRIDNGKYEWRHEVGSRFAKRSESVDPRGIIRRILNVKAFKEEAERYASYDKTINGVQYSAYVSLMGKTRIVTWLDDVNRIRGWEKSRLLDDGRWETYRIGQVEYDVEPEPNTFVPDFGPDVKIVEVDKALDAYFSLDEAIFTREELGLVFAVHELKRCEGDLIYTVCSIRPTCLTRKKVKSSGPAVSDYGSFSVGNAWRRLDDYGRGRSFVPITLAHVYHAGLEVQWVLFSPQGFEPEGPKECEFEVYISTGGKLRQERKKDGLSIEQNFESMAILPLPQEQTTLQQVMDDTYSAIMELEPLVAFDRLSQKLQLVPFTDEEMDAWAQKVPMSPASKKWLSGDKSWRLSHELPSSEISKEDWVRDRMDYLQEIENNYKEFLQEAEGREQGSR